MKKNSLKAGMEVLYVNEHGNSAGGTIIERAGTMYLLTDSFCEPLKFLPKRSYFMTTGPSEAIVQHIVTEVTKTPKKHDHRVKRVLTALRFWFKFEFLDKAPPKPEFADTIPNR